jgi:hypothetical protein
MSSKKSNRFGLVTIIGSILIDHKTLSITRLKRCRFLNQDAATSLATVSLPPGNPSPLNQGLPPFISCKFSENINKYKKILVSQIRFSQRVIREIQGHARYHPCRWQGNPADSFNRGNSQAFGAHWGKAHPGNSYQTTSLPWISAYNFGYGYLADLIRAYFQDGCKWGVKIDFSYESTPLGTAGPLCL